MWKFLFSFLFICDKLSSSFGQDLNIFAQRAFGFQTLKSFQEIYGQFNYPSVSSAEEAFYSRIANSKPTGKSGVVMQLESNKVSEILGIFRSSELIGSSEEADLKAFVNGSPGKTIRETLFKRSNGDTVYGIVGVVNLPKKVTLFYSFQKHQFISAPQIELQSKDDCVYWGIVCPYKLTFSLPNDDFVASEDENEMLYKYLKHSALKSYKDDSSAYVTYIDNEASRYSRFLPSDVADDLKKIADNPDKQPYEVFSEDPLGGERYEKIGV